jgi:hypothetical protein
MRGAYQLWAMSEVLQLAPDPDYLAAAVAGHPDTEVVAALWGACVPNLAAHKQLSAAFGIVGIPTMVLVGPDGTILASSPHLDASNLGEIGRPYL